MAKYKVSFYKPGQGKRQYGKARWGRYEKLRVAGFNKSEARDLSRASLDSPVIKSMMQVRRNLLAKFSKLVKENDWSQNQARFHWNKRITQWYRDRGFTEMGTRKKKGDGMKFAAKTGEPSIWEWYRLVERREYAKARLSDPELSLNDFRRRKSRTPFKAHHGGGKGNVDAQKSRARKRAESHRDEQKGWIQQLEQTKREHPERARQIDRQIKNLKRWK